MTTDNHDTCDAECVDGTECQHPAGSCPVPSHTDPDATNPHGRNFAITDDDHDNILQAARDGLSKAGCARTAGVDKASLLRYLDAHPDFRTDFMRARAEGEQKLINGALHREKDARVTMDGQHARFLLSTSFDYIKTEKKEVDMDADHTFDASEGVTAEFVVYDEGDDGDE